MHDDTRTQKKWLPFLLFFVVLVLYQVMPSYRILSDTTWALPTALSLIHEGNADLNEFSTLVEESNYYAIQTIDGNYYNFFPVGTSVLVAPPLFVIFVSSCDAIRC